MDLTALLKSVLKQVKKESKMNWQEISDKVYAATDFSISAESLRKNASGARPVSMKMCKNLLLKLLQSGFEYQLLIEALNQLINFEDFYDPSESKKLNKLNKNLTKELNELKMDAFRLMEKSIQKLIRYDFTDAEIIYMVDAILEKNIAPAGKSNGLSMIDPARVINFRKDHKKLLPIAISWNVSNINCLKE